MSGVRTSVLPPVAVPAVATRARCRVVHVDVHGAHRVLGPLVVLTAVAALWFGGPAPDGVRPPAVAEQRVPSPVPGRPVAPLP